MSMRLEMLQVARLAPRLLGESTDLVRSFLLRQQNPDGGFRGRSAASDLYYTVFALDSLLSLNTSFDSSSLLPFLRQFGDGEGLGLVHLCCLARAWAAVEYYGQRPFSFSKRCLEQIETFRTQDGGYSVALGGEHGTAYGCYLGFGAYQDLGAELPAADGLSRCLGALETADGAWANERSVPQGSTNASAAAVTLLRNLGRQPPQTAGDWLLARCHRLGGFLAAAQAPWPDLLSTATALHALAALQRDLQPIAERCLDFVDSLWTNEGGFHGHWADPDLDCEYIFYGLLALGHLTLQNAA